jgi:hypothetical protein
MNTEETQKVRDQFDRLNDRVLRLEADRKWLLLVGLVFGGLLGVTNFVSVPAAAEKEATRAAREEVKNRMPDIVQQQIADYIAKRSGIDFEDALHKYVAEAEGEKARAFLAANKAREFQAMAETELQKMLGSKSVCMLASPCPDGWQSKGRVGLIWEKRSGTAPFSNGAELNPDWTWIHPALCCR